MAEEEEDAGGGFRLSKTQSLILHRQAAVLLRRLATICALSLSFSLMSGGQHSRERALVMVMLCDLL